MENLFSSLPTPLEILLAPSSFIVYAIYGGLIIWEAFFPARNLPKVKFWKAKGVFAFFSFFFISTYLPLLWDGYLANYQLMDLTHLGTFGGACLGIVIYELGEYVWHRTMHGSNLLWRSVHQMHHSAERLDSFGAYYFSPLGMIFWTALGSFSLVVIAGFTAEATTIVILATTFLSIFQHSNIKTPHWLGYFIQRPEAHSIHHQKGVHAYNYSGIPLIDILFGTFRNPEEFEGETGFYDGASSRILDMLMFKDVSKPEKNG